MKKLYAFIFVLLLALPAINVAAQCRDFAEKVIKDEMRPYTHDGNYNAVLLSQGQNIELTKVFNSNIDYKVIICGSPNLPAVRFMIKEVSGNVIYDNKSANNHYEFKPTSSVKLIISIEVPNNYTSNMEGCVTALFGVK